MKSCKTNKPASLAWGFVSRVSRRLSRCGPSHRRQGAHTPPRSGQTPKRPGGTWTELSGARRRGPAGPHSHPRCILLPAPFWGWRCPGRRGRIAFPPPLPPRLPGRGIHRPQLPWQRPRSRRSPQTRGDRAKAREESHSHKHPPGAGRARARPLRGPEGRREGLRAAPLSSRRCRSPWRRPLSLGSRYRSCRVPGPRLPIRAPRAARPGVAPLAPGPGGGRLAPPPPTF